MLDASDIACGTLALASLLAPMREESLDRIVARREIQLPLALGLEERAA